MPRRAINRPYELIDIPSGEVLATAPWRHDLFPTVRDLIEREGRQRATSLLTRGGYYFEDDGTPVDPEFEVMTGEELAGYAFGEPFTLDPEPPIGLDPHPFSIHEYEALPECKAELIDGGLFDNGRERATVLRALLANMGLRAAIKLAPRELWLAALGDE